MLETPEAWGYTREEVLGCKTMGAAILFPKFPHKLQMHLMVLKETKWLPNASFLVYAGL